MQYIITQADLKKNKEDIISLWKRNFPDIPKERYDWIYEESPYGPASCWLINETTQNKIVGATTLFPRRILFEGKKFIAGIAGDFVIDKDHRTLGPALLLQKTAISNGGIKTFDLLYGFPNKQSKPVLLRGGYEILSDVFEMTKPLQSQYYVKQYIDVPVATDILAKTVDFIMKLMSKESYHKNIKKYSYEVPANFDNRFDELWKEASTHYFLIGEKSSSFLNWRFKRFPIEYRIFSLVTEGGGKVLGYIVFNTSKKRTQIVDFLVADMEEIFSTLISEFIKFQRKIGIDSISISFAGNRVLVDKLRQFGFSLRSREGKALLFTPPGFRIPLEKFEKENWYLTSGDNDI